MEPKMTKTRDMRVEGRARRTNHREVQPESHSPPPRETAPTTRTFYDDFMPKEYSFYIKIPRQSIPTYINLICTWCPNPPTCIPFTALPVLTRLILWSDIAMS